MIIEYWLYSRQIVWPLAVEFKQAEPKKKDINTPLISFQARIQPFLHCQFHSMLHLWFNRKLGISQSARIETESLLQENINTSARRMKLLSAPVTTLMLLASLLAPVLSTPVQAEANEVNASCYITSKKGKDCNASSCRHGGGSCTYNEQTKRCRTSGDWSKVFECKTNCRCAKGSWGTRQIWCDCLRLVNEFPALFIFLLTEKSRLVEEWFVGLWGSLSTRDRFF